MNDGAGRRRLAIALAAAAGMAAWGAARAIPKDADSWIRIDTEHFSVLSDASPRQTREIVQQLEEFRVVLGQVTSGISLTSPVPVSVFLFKNETSFEPYRGGRPGEDRGKWIGYFVPGTERNYLAINAGAAVGTEGFGVVYHEYVHEVLSHNLVKPPVWLNEGLAEYYSTFWSNSERAEIGRPPRQRIEGMLVIPPMPLTDLFAVTSDSSAYNERNLQQAFYAESWALVHYLILGNVSRRAQLQDLVKRLQIGEPSSKAQQKVFGPDLAPLEQELATYLRRGSYPFHVYKLKEANVPGVPDPVAAGRLEVIGALGHLLAHIANGKVEAESHFRAVLEAAPADPRALAGLASLSETAGRHDEARSLYAKSLAAAPDDPEVLFLSAQNLLETAGRKIAAGDPVPPGVLAARDLLQRSLLGAPNNFEAYAALGLTYVGDGGDVSVGIASLEKALPSLPDRADVAYGLVLLYAQEGNREAATKLLDGRLRAVGSKREIEEAEDAIVAIDLKDARSAAAAGDTGKALAILRGMDGRFHDPERAAWVSRSIRRLEAHRADLSRRDAYKSALALYESGDYSGAVKGFEPLAADCGDDRSFCDAVNTALEYARSRAAQAARNKPKPH
jgi:tetratricopeptide (TPR) repeat protein